MENLKIDIINLGQMYFEQKKVKGFMTEVNKRLEDWNLDNSYAGLPKIFYSNIDLNPVSAPELVILNSKLAEFLGLNSEALRSKDGVFVLAGNNLPPNSIPIAQAYAGHQFGYFTMLGDGRAVLLGEQITPKGQRFDIQLKGSGITPYSRGGDGRAALGPMLREYIISEAMHGLGISTTRSLAVVTTGEMVARETNLTGAVLTRVAMSHLRVGTFQFVSKWGNVQNLKLLADYTIKRHYSWIENEDNKYLAFLREVIKRQASLIAKWLLAGFIHGVMNTDNMALSGETIDYGPCAFIDTYDPATVFSSIDTYGRYAYGNQPGIGAWNLSRFAETLLPLLHDKENQAIELAQNEISNFDEYFQQGFLNGMRKKLGLFNEETEDGILVEEFLNIMEKYKADYTNTFISLTFGNSTEETIYDSKEFKNWLEKWRGRLNRQVENKDDVFKLMKSSNPAVIPRNHRVEEALEAAEHGDYAVTNKLIDILSRPYAHCPEQKEYSAPPSPSTCPYKTFCGT